MSDVRMWDVMPMDTICYLSIKTFIYSLEIHRTDQFFPLVSLYVFCIWPQCHEEARLLLCSGRCTA